MQSHKWVLRALLVLAVAVPVGLFTTDRPPPPRPQVPPPTPRLIELLSVYDALPEHPDFDRLQEWCVLTPREATADEADTIRAAVRGAVEPVPPIRDPLMGRWPDDPGRRAELVRVAFETPDRTGYVRLSDPAVSSRWIGLVIRRYYNTAQWDQLIAFRVAVGF
ncbi:MAG: hypothetical protein U0804_07835 [Gemmataceae bacterium]